MTTILIVDDEIEQGELLQRYFKRLQRIEQKSYEVIAVNSGELALKEIEKDTGSEIDLIIADLRMPAAQVDGWNLIKLLSKKNINTKIIVVTAWGQPENFTEEEGKNIVFF